MSECTVWTSSGSGRTLTLAFNGSNELQSVSGSASSGTPPEATFCYYGESSCAPSSGGLTGDLYSATDPGSLTTTYAYDYTNTSTSGCPGSTEVLRPRSVDHGWAGKQPERDQHLQLSSGQVNQQDVLTNLGGSASSSTYDTTFLCYTGTPASATGGTTTVHTALTVDPGTFPPSNSCPLSSPEENTPSNTASCV